MMFAVGGDHATEIGILDTRLQFVLISEQQTMRPKTEEVGEAATLGKIASNADLARIYVQTWAMGYTCRDLLSTGTLGQLVWVCVIDSRHLIVVGGDAEERRHFTKRIADELHKHTTRWYHRDSVRVLAVETLPDRIADLVGNRKEWVKIYGRSSRGDDTVTRLEQGEWLMVEDGGIVLIV